MNKDRTFRIFIGHAWNYKNEYFKLEKMLDETPGFRWQNIFPGFVTPKDDPLDELYNALKRQIESSEIVLILSDLYESNKSWIQKEIEMAKNMEKPIIVVGPMGEGSIPEELLKSATYIVDWDSESLVDAINNAVLQHEMAPARKAKGRGMH